MLIVFILETISPFCKVVNSEDPKYIIMEGKELRNIVEGWNVDSAIRDDLRAEEI